VKGKRCLEQADVVIYDYLANPRLLDHATADAERILVGKHGGGERVEQSMINALIVERARQGKTVVRLKGGDPFVFGRGGEEALALRAAGIDFEIVPGVSAGFAGPAAAAIPVTHRGVARSVAFVTGETDPGAGGRPVDWAAIAAIDTVVVFMAGRSAATVADRLIVAGRDPSTPAAVLVDATLPCQTVLWLDLETLRRRGAGRTRRPTMLVVGDVVGIGAAITAHAAAPEPDSDLAEAARGEPPAIPARTVDAVGAVAR
jgi:uroporphyrin-III C-methyltransferase